jgi:iron complex outermembrane receptor protein
VTEDVGLRYRTTLPTGQETIWRLTVKNLTNHAYWMSNEYVGAPRTIAFSGTVKF